MCLWQWETWLMCHLPQPVPGHTRKCSWYEWLQNTFYAFFTQSS
jgi:hypothetical protein